MLTEFLPLLCLGLCLGYEDEKTNETLPKPLLTAWPSSVVERKSNVTLMCSSLFQNSTFRLGKLDSPGSEQQLSSVENSAELLLTDLEPMDAGKYFCIYKTTTSLGWSQSEHLQLVVTDGSEGHRAPTIVCKNDVKVDQGGNEELSTLASKQGSRIIFVTTFTCLSIFLSFLSIFLIYRCTQHDSAHEESTRRTSLSDFPEEEATDLEKSERASLSAEDPQGNTRALCETASVSTEEPPESCEYATLKM